MVNHSKARVFVQSGVGGPKVQLGEVSDDMFTMFITYPAVSEHSELIVLVFCSFQIEIKNLSKSCQASTAASVLTVTSHRHRRTVLTALFPGACRLQQSSLGSVKAS